MTTGLKHKAARRAAARADLARFVIFWERLWPVLLPALAPLFLLVVASLFGLWRATPGWLHLALTGLAGGASLYALLRFGRELAWPSRREGLARLEADGRLAHAPLQALEDRPFGEAAASPLWRAHLDVMAEKAKAVRLNAPRATADARDPWGLRYAAPGLLLVALVAAGPERHERLADLFNPGAALAGGTALADLWIEPPAYTGKAPIYLLRAGEAAAGARAQINAPEGSTVVAQAGGARRVALDFRTADERVEAEAEKGRHTLVLAESGLLRFRLGGAEGRWPVGVIPDDPPAVDFAADPSTTDDARLALSLVLDDDYGVTGVTLELRLDPDQARPLDASDFDESSIRTRRVVEIEGASGRGERQIDLDLQADPWAGLKVIGRLIAVDAAGQSGASDEAAFALPERPFFNPLAKAVIEQRQTLAVAPQDWRRAGRSFDALTLAPERFYERSTDYLLIRTAFRRVMRQGGGEGFESTVEEFWPLALQLEDEALELARRQLEAAREALRQALERGASDAELERLVEAMREAMRQYLQALARSGRQMAEEGGENGETLNEGDLEEMLDSIRDLAQSGAQNAARQALSDLENILNNLRLSSRGQGEGGETQGQGRGEGQGGAAGEAGDLIGRQRDLANRSFERGRTPGATGEALAGEEGDLAGDLSSLIDRLRGNGEADPDGDGARALGEALDAMREAERALERDNFDAAGTAMERAIDGLRDGAGALAEARARGEREQRAGEGRAGRMTDPLGRPIGDAYGDGVDVPDVSDAQRARELLMELRRRLSDGERDEDEIDYLERLLNRF